MFAKGIPASGIGLLALLFGTGLTALPSDSRTGEVRQRVLASRVPTEFYLSQNSPDPFYPPTSFNFGIPAWDEFLSTNIAVYALDGRRIRTLFSGFKAPGNYSLAWDGQDDQGRAAPGGKYLYRIRVANRFHDVKMMTLSQRNPRRPQ